MADDTSSLPSTLNTPPTDAIYRLTMLNYNIKQAKYHEYQRDIHEEKLEQTREALDELNEDFTVLEHKLMVQQLTDQESQEFDHLCKYKYALLNQMQNLYGCIKHEMNEMVDRKKEAGHWRLIIKGLRATEVNGNMVYEFDDDQI